MFHPRNIIYLLGFVSFVYAGTSSSVMCPDEKKHVLDCEQTIIGVVDAQLEPYGQTFSTTNLDNNTESELLDEKTRDVVCSTANAEYVSCMVGNISACPELAADDDIVSTWIASLIAPHLDVLNSVDRVCEFFEESVCSYREIRLSMCYLSIVGDTVTLNQKVDMCSSGKMDKLTCMIDIYKECKPYLNLTSNGIIAANIRDHMVNDNWDMFSTGTELCGCYEADTCFSKLDQEITSIGTTINSTVRERMIHIVVQGELLCSNVTLVQCLKKGTPRACSNIIQNFNDTRAKIEVYSAEVDQICKIINTKEFKRNKPCVINQLTETYYPCVEREKIPANIYNCRDLQKLFKCVGDALNGKCNGDYTNTVYGIIKTSFNDVIDCDITSTAFVIYPNYTVLLILLFVYQCLFQCAYINS
ncbi:uncharacterized protein LOC132748712 [Ruditapes philippinarum]|uniref:uncharacterized protein LOC132748712 n=1 Tax=Ruditapes philippinarum TaxID=129788 RepID=UPI00295BEF33|nr:uncharacterized protein LOC132748712 [Ruditapes philippinarum]